MSWKTFHSRGETLRVVMDTVNDRRDGTLPMQVPGVADHFDDELDLIGALLLKWHARLSGHIERSLVREPMDLASAVAAAWRATAEEMPGVRLVIDRCTEDPTGPEMEQAMLRARESEWARLAVASGLANAKDAAAVAVGRRVEERARVGLGVTAAPLAAPVPTPAPTAAPTAAQFAPTGASLAERIKAVIAA